MVIWGTLLQRLVPPEMIGRVASLDFFVSIAFMPVSIAIAGPLSLIVPIPAIFIVAGVAPTLLAIVALGATFVMALSEFDLSVGAVVSMAGIVCASLFAAGWGIAATVAVTLAAGFVVGCASGFLVAA